MADVGVVPLTTVNGPSALQPKVTDFPALMAVCGRLVAIESAKLGAEVRQLSDEEMALVEDGLAELFALRFLCAQAPQLPQSPAGAADYPRWGEIYYVGPAINDQTKRHVVVSNDHWNQSAGVSTVVRTTTQLKRAGTAFPSIETGQACACCGDATTFPHEDFELQRRPNPNRLSLEDMVVVAKGLVETHVLHEAVRRLGI